MKVFWSESHEAILLDDATGQHANLGELSPILYISKIRKNPKYRYMPLKEVDEEKIIW